MMQALPTTDVEYQAGAAWGEARTMKHREYEEVVISYTGVMRGDLSASMHDGAASLVMDQAGAMLREAENPVSIATSRYAASESRGYGDGRGGGPSCCNG